MSVMLCGHDEAEVRCAGCDGRNARLGFVPMGRWISVADRLPEDDDGDALYLVSIAVDRPLRMNGHRVTAAVDLARLLAGGVWYIGDSPTELHITHWMSLPDPPTDMGDSIR